MKDDSSLQTGKEEKLKGKTAEGIGAFICHWIFDTHIFLYTVFPLPETSSPLTLHPVSEWSIYEWIKNASLLNIVLIPFLPRGVCESRNSYILNFVPVFYLELYFLEISVQLRIRLLVIRSISK